ncbi:hypothetical protein [Bacillus pinisoli]|uniref:hypothetical protein n=1 Tax=Bacillus pinisoli TaxID=2901866 RepID=UPI001FF3B030|nr:hypothetical protein [Bacillus pinisoli]
MNKPLKIYIHYKIKPNHTNEYEKIMEKVIGYMPSFGAHQIDWYSPEKDMYAESFSLPTISHFIALRNLRNGKKHSIFGLLDQFIEGGVENVQIHAVKVQ